MLIYIRFPESQNFIVSQAHDKKIEYLSLFKKALDLLKRCLSPSGPGSMHATTGNRPAEYRGVNLPAKTWISR